MKKIIRNSSIAILSVFLISCSSAEEAASTPVTVIPTQPTGPNEVDFWLTKSDESVKLTKQSNVLNFGTNPNNYPNINVNPTQTFQSIDGFGYTLTAGSVQVINGLESSKKQELLQDLFNPTTGIGVSYLRISIGASDLNGAPFTYNDLPAGQTDESLQNFSLSNDAAVIALLNDIKTINPNIKIMATPWSAPVWMKDNNLFVAGSLLPQYYGTYAQYFVKYIQGMQAAGIRIDAITPQNEPLNPYNNPSMYMAAADQATFIKNHLGPAFQAAGISTKIIIYDHNCDFASYPINILNDAAANAFIDGSAFHLYAGDISALSTVHNAYPEKHLYFTEQYTPSNGSFSGDLKWHLKNVIVGSMRNWSRNALEWNVANNQSFGPHTDGGCTVCKGAITITGSTSYTKNVAYYIIAHASKFVPAGSVRVQSNISGNLNNVAFVTPDGKKVLIVENDGANAETFNITSGGKWITVTLDAGSVATYVW